jgi:hypothetical protein
MPFAALLPTSSCPQSIQKVVKLNEKLLTFVAHLTSSVDNSELISCVSSPQYR